jgi:hypothetical protein
MELNKAKFSQVSERFPMTRTRNGLRTRILPQATLTAQDKTGFPWFSNSLSAISQFAE